MFPTMPSICNENKENSQYLNPQNINFYDARGLDESYSPIRKPAKKKDAQKRAVNQKSEKLTSRLSAERTNSSKCKRKINCSLMGLYKNKATAAIHEKKTNYNSVRSGPIKD